jgi:hypothetical protein
MALIGRTRAILGIAALWGTAWSIPGLIWLGLGAARGDAPSFDLLSFARDVVLNWTVVGAIGGTLFALALRFAERRRTTLASLRMRRVVSWGALGAAALPLVVIPIIPLIAPDFARQLPAIHNLSSAVRQALLAGTVYGALGGNCAGGSLSLARRADRGLASTSGNGSVSAVPPAP